MGGARYTTSAREHVFFLGELGRTAKTDLSLKIVDVKFFYWQKIFRATARYIAKDSLTFCQSEMHTRNAQKKTPD